MLRSATTVASLRVPINAPNRDKLVPKVAIGLMLDAMFEAAPTDANPIQAFANLMVVRGRVSEGLSFEAIAALVHQALKSAIMARMQEEAEEGEAT